MHTPHTINHTTTLLNWHVRANVFKHNAGGLWLAVGRT